MSYNQNLVEVRTYDIPQTGGVVVDVSGHDHHHHGHAHGHDHSHGHADVGFKTQPTTSLKWLRNLSIVAIILSLVQIGLTILHLVKKVNLGLNIVGLVAGVAFFILAILYYRWTGHTRSHGKAGHQQELLAHAEKDEHRSRRLFIAGVLLTVVAVTAGINYYVQRGYNADVNYAQATTEESWTWGNANYTRLRTFYKIAYPLLAGFQIFFVVYFLFAARTTFRVLKFGNQAVTLLVFIGALMTAFYGCQLLFASSHAQNYDVYPQLEAHYPQWVLRSFFAVSIAVIALSFITFLVNHRGWRVGFVLVGLLFIISTLFLVSLVAPSLSHTRKIYNYYNGTASDSSDAIAWQRLHIVDEEQIESWGCPAKYVDATNCAVGDQITRWEDYPKNSTSTLRAVDTNNDAENTPEATPALTTLTFALEENRVLASAILYCLNTACEGVNAQLYAQSFLDVSNAGLLTLLFSAVIVIGTAYFWYVNWVDRARKTSNDYCWALWMAIFTIATVLLLIFVDVPLITEQLVNGAHQ